MSDSRQRQPEHDKYKKRISDLFEIYKRDKDREDSNIESESHNAKYLAVLVSGYLEQAIKELLLGYAFKESKQEVSRYIEKTWPKSKNMKTGPISEILGYFKQSWSEKFNNWLKQEESRKDNINSIVQWRNSIAHGEESNTTGVTLNSVRLKFETAKELVLFIEGMVSE